MLFCTLMHHRNFPSWQKIELFLSRRHQEPESLFTGKHTVQCSVQIIVDKTSGPVGRYTEAFKVKAELLNK
jgi:hypothetical protein